MSLDTLEQCRSMSKSQGGKSRSSQASSCTSRRTKAGKLDSSSSAKTRNLEGEPERTDTSAPHTGTEHHPKQHVPPDPLIDRLDDRPVELGLAE